MNRRREIFGQANQQGKIHTGSGHSRAKNNSVKTEQEEVMTRKIKLSLLEASPANVPGSYPEALDTGTEHENRKISKIIQYRQDSKHDFFTEIQLDYNRSTEVTVLSPSFLIEIKI
jgi:hypothetical protein